MTNDDYLSVMKSSIYIVRCVICLLAFNSFCLVHASTLRHGVAPRDTSRTVMLYFRFDRSLLEKDYLTNAQSLDTLRAIMTKPEIISQMDSIVIHASASPEGSPYRNQTLARERAAAVKSYLMWQYPFLNRDSIFTHSIGENWEGLRQMVEVDTDMPYRTQVLDIIDSDLDAWTKDQKIQQLENGVAFDYMVRNMLRYLRSGAACIVFYKKPAPKPVPMEVSVDTVVVVEEVAEETVIALPVKIEPAWQYKRPLALKTNLLFDLATALNVEVEVPLGRRFSVAGEWTFPWWLWERKQYCLELLSGTLEGRYWLKPNYARQEETLGQHNPLTGWFVGLYGSAGKYDLEWKRKGYQGEFALSTGLTFGYVKPLSRNLNMEFSLSAGYLQTDYRYYNARQDAEGEWHLIKQYPGTFRWIGPTKAKISLVWYPHFKSLKKGGKK